MPELSGDEAFRELQQLIARVESGAVDLNGVDWQDPKQIWIHQFAPRIILFRTK